MASAIKVENLSKAYRLGEIGTGTLSRDLERWFAKVRGKEDPFLTVGEANDRTVKGSSDVVWSLKNLNFEIEEGEAVGIIGRNGAGKSTLLKLLSRVSAPTTGNIKVKGRIASLLEVGTGFHPELTGRENVYLNGAILGMRKKEIARKFDEIVDFSGVERYIDTPVKRYSSGMYVRLAFAVAAYLESEILIVDEVLAVGDAEFQKKCLGKMGEVSKGEGRTVLFVSHNMASVSSLCKNGILLKNGRLEDYGGVKRIVDRYFQSNSSAISEFLASTDKITSKEACLERIVLLDKGELKTERYSYLDEIKIAVDINVNSFNVGMELGVSLMDKNNIKIFSINEKIEKYYKGTKKIKLLIKIPPRFLTPSTFSWVVGLHQPNLFYYDYVENVCGFEIVDYGSEYAQYSGQDFGFVFPKYAIEDNTCQLSIEQDNGLASNF